MDPIPLLFESILFHDPDLFFQIVAGLFLYNGAHLVTQCQHIGTGGTAQVHYKTAVLVAYGGTAMTVTPQAALVDEGRRKSARRAFCIKILSTGMAVRLQLAQKVD